MKLLFLSQTGEEQNRERPAYIHWARVPHNERFI